MPISKTDNVYLAMWAMLLAVLRHNMESKNKIKVVACPGLGTLTGRVPPMQAAKLMLLAYRNFINPPQNISWPFAQTRQQTIGVGGDNTII
jgi:O-acetyl-ADP-ribose deacetylase (regulator of RNase III)